MHAPVNPGDDAPRRYVSAKRDHAALDTRRRIRTAATELFMRDGYAATSVRQIARRANVAEKTVYLAFSTKAEILNEVIVAALRGEDLETPVTRGDTFRAMLAAPDEELLSRFAAQAAELMSRVAPALRLAEAAAGSDTALAAMRDRGHAAMRDDFSQLSATLAQRGLLRAGLTAQTAADTVYALVNETTFLRLTELAGYDARAYAAWLTDVLERTLLATRP